MGDFSKALFNSSSTQALVGRDERWDRWVDVGRGTFGFLPNGSYECAAAVSADGLLIAVTDGSIVKVGRPRSADREMQHIRTRSGRARALAFSPTSGIIAIGCDGGAIELRDPETGEDLGQLDGSASAVLALDFHCDGHVLASGDADGRIGIWDVKDLGVRGEAGYHNSPCVEVRFNPGGTLLASRGALEDFVNLWNPVNAVLVRCVAGLAGVTSIYFTADGSTLAALRKTNINRAAEAGRSPDRRSDVVTSLISLDSQQPTVLLRAFEDGEWLVYDDAGRFTTSEHATTKIGWRLGDRAFRVKALWNRYFVPSVWHPV